MTTRLIVAYSLLALLVLWGVGAAVWARHRSFPKRDARRRERDRQLYAQRVDNRDAAE